MNKNEWVSVYNKPTEDGRYDYLHSGMGVVTEMYWEGEQWRAYRGGPGEVMRGKDKWRQTNEKAKLAV